MSTIDTVMSAYESRLPVEVWVTVPAGIDPTAPDVVALIERATHLLSLTGGTLRIEFERPERKEGHA